MRVPVSVLLPTAIHSTGMIDLFRRKPYDPTLITT